MPRENNQKNHVIVLALKKSIALLKGRNGTNMVSYFNAVK